MRTFKTLFAVVGVVALAACDTKEAPGPLEPGGPTGRIRFVNLITDATRVPVNAILDGLPFGVSLAYGGTTPSSLPSPSTANYSAILAGPRTLVLKKTADTTVTVATIPLVITASQDLTVYATGGASASGVTPFLITDDNSGTVDATQTRIRAVNMSSGGAVDVFVTVANADLSVATATFSNVAAHAGSAYVNVAAGTYQIRTGSRRNRGSSARGCGVAQPHRRGVRRRHGSDSPRCRSQHGSARRSPGAFFRIASVIFRTEATKDPCAPRRYQSPRRICVEVLVQAIAVSVAK